MINQSLCFYFARLGTEQFGFPIEIDRHLKTGVQRVQGDLLSKMVLT